MKYTLSSIFIATFLCDQARDIPANFENLIFLGINMHHIIEKILYGGPADGQVIKIHKDTLNIKPIVTIKDESGSEFIYGLDNHDEFLWLPNPDDPKIARGWFVCDDDGNVISEENNFGDAM